MTDAHTSEGLNEKPSSIDAFLLAFFTQVYDATGYARPDGV
jgi:hypothetical protein